ncbi:hypothetical protein [uncultured Desulfobacter sp.]|uniref:hypothetical protein n=1 Tax=uncultured Desulfobacter sp. TaxID=240139 RepID=UPI002AAA68B6|nr:hypothetical protein [uncultured Desulfobacter sp.]
MTKLGPKVTKLQQTATEGAFVTPNAYSDPQRRFSSFDVLPVFKGDSFKSVVHQSFLMEFISDYNLKLEKTVEVKTQKILAINELLENEI